MHIAYLPPELLVGNLISLLTCGQSGPSEEALQMPRCCVADWDAAVDGVRWQHRLPSQQVLRKPGCSLERCSGETWALQVSGLWLSTLQGYCFGFTPIFPVPTGCLRECAEESSGLFKVWKQHEKPLPCMRLSGIANFTHSVQGDTGWFKKLLYESQWEFLALALLA